MPLSRRALLQWEPTPAVAEGPPVTMNASATASTTAYHSAPPSYGRTESYTHSSTTGMGNTFDTSHSSLHGPSYVTSTLPGSDGGAAPAGFPYRWKPGVISRTSRATLPAPLSKPPRLLTRHTMAPLLPTSEELLRHEGAALFTHTEGPQGECASSLTNDSTAAAAVVHPSAFLFSPSAAAAVSPPSSPPSSPAVAAAAASSRPHCPRCTRQSGAAYTQQIQRRCKTAAAMPHACDVHEAITPGCAACRSAMVAASAPRTSSSRRSLSFVAEAGDVSTSQLPQRQWHWTGGGNVHRSDASAVASGATVASERHRLASSCLAAIAGPSPFSHPHSSRAASGAGHPALLHSRGGRSVVAASSPSPSSSSSSSRLSPQRRQSVPVAPRGVAGESVHFQEPSRSTHSTPTATSEATDVRGSVGTGPSSRGFSPAALHAHSPQGGFQSPNVSLNASSTGAAPNRDAHASGTAAMPLVPRLSSATSVAPSAEATPATSPPMVRSAPAIMSPPAWGAAGAASNTLGGGEGSDAGAGPHRRETAGTIPLPSTPASTSLASPLIFRAMPPVVSAGADRQPSPPHPQLPPSQRQMSSSVSFAVQPGGDGVTAAAPSLQPLPEWSVEHAPLAQPRSQGNSFTTTTGAATTKAARSRPPFVFSTINTTATTPTTTATTTPAVASSSTAPGFLSFGALRQSDASHTAVSGASSPLSVVSVLRATSTASLAAAPPPTTSTTSALQPQQQLFSVASAEERTSPLWRTPNWSANASAAFPSLASASSSLTGVPAPLAGTPGRQATTSTTSTTSRAAAGFPNAPPGKNGSGEWDEKSRDVPIEGPAGAPASPATAPEVRDTGVLLVMPAGIVVTSSTSVATDRFSWTTTAPPDAALAVVERHVKKSKTPRSGPRFTGDVRASTSSSTRAALVEEVDCVVTYFPVHTEVLKRHSGYFAALFDDSGSPYVHSRPDEYVDLADLPYITTEAETHVKGRVTGGTGRGDGVAGSTLLHTTAAESCLKGPHWPTADGVRERHDSPSGTDPLNDARGQEAGRSGSAVVGAPRDDGPSPTRVPVYYFRGPGCDGGGFSPEPWRSSRPCGEGSDEEEEAAAGPQLSASGVAQLIHYFYTGALPLFHRYEDIINARSSVLEMDAPSTLAWSFAEIFSMAYYTSLNSLTQAMLNVLWRLLSVTHDVLPMWAAAVDWGLPDMQALCEQWIEEHLTLFLRANTARGLWRGLDVSQVELLVALRTGAVAAARELAAEAAPVHGSEEEETEETGADVSPSTSSPNRAAGDDGEGSGSDATVGDAPAPLTTAGAASLFYGWPTPFGLPQPLSTGAHPRLPATSPQQQEHQPHHEMQRSDSETGVGGVGSSSGGTLRGGGSSPPPPLLPPQTRLTSSPASPALRASQHFEDSPVSSFASGRRPQEGAQRGRLSPPAHSPAATHRGRPHDDDHRAGEPAEASASAAVGDLATPPLTTTTTTATTAPAAAAPPLIPGLSPVAHAAPSPVLSRTLSWPAHGERSAIGSPTSTPTTASNAVGSVAAQQFWLDSGRPSPLGTAATPTWTPGLHSTTPLAFEDLVEAEVPAGLARSNAGGAGGGDGQAAAVRVFSSVSSAAPRSGEARHGTEAPQHARDGRSLRHAASSHTSWQTGSDVSLAVPTPLTTVSAPRNSYIHFSASPTNTASAVFSASASPTLHGSFAAAPHPTTQPSIGAGLSGSCSRPSCGSTPRLRYTPASPFQSTSWMVVPPTLQLLADGAWRIGGYGRLYTVETREVLEARQAVWLHAEHEQHKEDRMLDEVFLSEGELLERLWTWWTTYVADAAADGGSVTAEETTIMVAMLRGVCLREVADVSEPSPLSTESEAVVPRALATVLAEVRCFLGEHSEPTEL